MKQSFYDTASMDAMARIQADRAVAAIEVICERCAAAHGLINQDTPLARQRRVYGYPRDLCVVCADETDEA